MAVDVEEVEGVAGEEAEGVAREADPSVVVAGSQEVMAALLGLSSGMTTIRLKTKPHISKLVEGVGVCYVSTLNSIISRIDCLGYK